MKRNLLSILLLTITIGYAIGQEAITTVPVQTTDTSSHAQDEAIKALSQCSFTPVTHWSVGIKAGGNYFRVATEPVSRLNQAHLIVAATVEYTINPLVGIGLEYMDNPYSRSYYLDETQTTTGKINGSSQDVIFFGSVNLSNLLTPYRKGCNSKWNVYANTGFGYAFYNNAMDVRPNNINMGPMGNVGVNAEYDLSKSLSFGVEGQYRYYHRKLVSGDQPGNSNALTLTIGLRYKLDANGKKQHARNISMCEYYPKPAPVIIEKVVRDNTPETLNRLKALETENDSINKRNQRLSDELRALSLRNKKAETTAIVENNDALNNKIQKMEDDLKALSLKDKGVVNASFDYIEFELGSDKLTSSSRSTLDKIAAILVRNPGWTKLDIGGHTDSSGSSKLNQNLSKNRANAVKNYLLSKDVPASNITSAGYGSKYPIAPNETADGRKKNRRVEFKITK